MERMRCECANYIAKHSSMQCVQTISFSTHVTTTNRGRTAGAFSKCIRLLRRRCFSSQQTLTWALFSLRSSCSSLLRSFEARVVLRCATERAEGVARLCRSQ